MGMIRVSDHAEKLIREHSHGRTITATVDAILAGSVAPDGTELWKGQGPETVIDHFDKRLDELKTLIEDTTVDRLSQGGRAPRSSNTIGSKEWVYWDQMQYIIFTHDDDDPAWLVPEGAVFQFKNGDPTSYSYYIKDDTIYMENGGRPVPLIKVTPEVQKAIDEKLTYD